MITIITIYMSFTRGKGVCLRDPKMLYNAHCKCHCDKGLLSLCQPENAQAGCQQCFTICTIYCTAPSGSPKRNKIKIDKMK